MIVVPALYLRFGHIDSNARATRDPFAAQPKGPQDVPGQVRPVSQAEVS